MLQKMENTEQKKEIVPEKVFVYPKKDIFLQNHRNLIRIRVLRYLLSCTHYFCANEARYANSFSDRSRIIQGTSDFVYTTFWD